MSATTTVEVPARLLGKIIGAKGATRKDIESDYGVQLDIPQRGTEDPDGDGLTEVTIRGPTNAAVGFAKARILDICGLAKDAASGDRARIDRMRAEKDALFAQANAAPRGPEREALFAKAHQLKDDIAAEEAKLGDKVFEAKNAGYGLDQMDLHGLSVDQALDFVRKRLAQVDAQLKSGKLDKLTIITGAGHHSGDGGPKIKPAVCELLQTSGYPFQVDEAGGQVFVFAKGSVVPVPVSGPAAAAGGAAGAGAGAAGAAPRTFVDDILDFLSELFTACTGLGRAPPPRT